jgi:c-di-GMP-binding flagellar brake protein YcgR
MFDEPEDDPVAESDTASSEDTTSDEPVFEIDEETGRLKRENVRIDVKLPITVSFEDGPTVETRTRDVSATGLGFATRVPLAIEQRGAVTLQFSDWQFAKDFTVRYVKPILAGNQVGVQFDDLRDDEYSKLVKEVFAIQRLQAQSK